MIINTSIDNLLGLNALRMNDRDLRTRMERLSSGLRINRGSDDPSGLAIAAGMRAQIRGLTTSIQNVQDGLSLIRTVDGSLAEMQDIVQRMRDLSVRAANEAALNTDQRKIIQDELKEQARTLRMLSTNLTFNGKDLNGKQKVVFQSNRDGNDEIYVMDLDGTNQTNITNSPGANRNPIVSPDGTKIAYDSLAGNWDIIVADADGSNPVNISNSASPDLAKTWSPDGSQLLFRSERDGNMEIYVVNSDGDPASLINITNNPASDTVPAQWSPDGTRIVFVTNRDGNNEIYVVNRDGTNPVNLTSNAGQDSWPVWSPDGTKIAFISNRTGNQEIFVVNADGTGLVNVSNSPAIDAQPVWSPDSTRIAFAAAPGLIWNLFTVNADGTNRQQITNDPEFDQFPTWAPDGNSLVYSRRTGAGVWDVYSIGFESGATPVNLSNTPSEDKVFGGGWFLGVSDTRLQVGPNSSDSLEIALRPVSPESLGVGGLGVMTNAMAAQAITLCDHAVAYLGDYRAELGAVARRLAHIIDDNTAMHTNLSAAESRIRDADMALEVTAKVRADIIRQSTTSLLARESELRQAAADLLLNSLG